MVTGLGFGDMNLAICEGVICCLMKMAPTHPTHTHHEAQIRGQRILLAFLRFIIQPS